jgi:hypothetical protein
MTNATEPTDMAVNGDVVGRIREHEFRLGALEQTIVGSLVAGICALRDRYQIELIHPAEE